MVRATRCTCDGRRTPDSSCFRRRSGGSRRASRCGRIRSDFITLPSGLTISKRAWKDSNGARIKIILPPYAADTITYGEKTGGKVLTCLFEDPDGTILQFDQYVK